ncbi:hypothetical protein [Streptomyces collinus]|nr:hypothetical protein [Streptomyces collinus]
MHLFVGVTVGRPQHRSGPRGEFFVLLTFLVPVGVLVVFVPPW